MERGDCELVRMELERVLASRTFASSARSRQLLDYLVRVEVEGRSGALKGYTVAVEALGQPEDFDPSTSSLVRTQMRKLRELLDTYYAREGRHAAIRFEAPKGRPAVSVVPNRNAKRMAFRTLLTLFDGPVRANPHLFAAWVYRASITVTLTQLAVPLMFVERLASYPVLVAALLVSPLAYTPAAVLVAWLLTLLPAHGSGPLRHAVAGAVAGLPYWLVVLAVRWLGAWPVAGTREAVLVLIGAVVASAGVFGMIGYARDYREGGNEPD